MRYNRKTDAERKTVNYGFRMTRAENDFVMALANECGIRFADVMRYVVNDRQLLPLLMTTVQNFGYKTKLIRKQKKR